MIKDIKYGGYTAQPSDYECQDGDLAISLNLINEDGAIHSVSQPELRFTIGQGRKIFIHKIGSTYNYISYSPQSQTIEWIGTETEGKFAQTKIIFLPYDIGIIINIASVGYILAISTTLNLYYVRFNAKKEAYVFLGSKIPEIFLDLALKLNFTVSETQEKTFDVVHTGGGGNSGGSTTGNNDWSVAIATSYDVSSANGLLKREWVNDEKYRDTHVSTQFKPFDSTFKIKANVEYKLKWDIVTGCHSNMTIGIWGNRNGSSECEMMCWAANQSSMPSTRELKLMFDDEWTNVCYIIDFEYNDISSANCATSGNITWYKGIDNSGSGSEDVSTYIEYTPESHTALMGAINKFIKEQATDKSRFIYPFFARYAVKLYDGSYSHISDPLLMIPNSGYVPAISFSKHPSFGTRLILSAFAADIKYKVRGSIPEDWEDLITGIDVFVSQPIWPYNQSQNYDGSTNYFRFKHSIDSKGFGRAYFDDVPCDEDNYQSLNLQEYLDRYASNIITNNYVQVASRSDEDIRKDVIATANFYKICSLGLTEIKEAMVDFADIALNKELLSSLVTREALKDDTLQYIGFRNAYLKEYNSRLHVYHSSVLLRKPTHPKDCLNYISAPDDNKISTYVYLATNDGIKSVQRIEDSSVNGAWFYYPDSRAYKAVFYLEDNAGNILGVSEIDLKRHDFLNGAYWFAGSYCDKLTFGEPSEHNLPKPDTDNDSISTKSTIYVSEINCPFVFKSISAVTVGAQEVIALSTAAKALSQGQFGQFPLYAFTDEGIWALELSSTGSYTAKQPITRDVSIHPQGITQIDSAVLFPSARGIMLISGSTATCISDTIKNDAPFDILKLPHMDKLHAMLGHNADTCLSTAPFLKFISECGMLYDYVHQRVIVYNPKYTYAYVYSLKSKEWGMMYSTIEVGINSYPEALAVDHDGTVLNFSSMKGEKTKGLFVTRPIKLETPDVLKTMDTVIQRGHFQKGHVQSVLYGSRDLYNWHLVWSSKDHYLRGFHGTPYKYFRIACVTSLADDESIFGASLQFNPRQTNQPR